MKRFSEPGWVWSIYLALALEAQRVAREMKQQSQSLPPECGAFVDAHFWELLGDT